jgi:hypothetical protein
MIRKVLAIAVAAFFATAVVALATGNKQPPARQHGMSFGPFCISKSTGVMRAVRTVQPCHKGETRIKHINIAAGAGATGTSGAAGATGPAGAAGAQGPAGPVGATGTHGATGAAGTNGTNGIDGKNGVDGKDGTNGTNGEVGPIGPTGPAGAPGANGVSGYEVHTYRYSKDDNNSDAGPGYGGVGGGGIATVVCSPGKVALGGGYWFTSPDNGGFNAEQALTNGSGVTASFPGRMDWDTNTVKQNDNSGWIVQVNKNVQAADMTLYVICANAS